MNAELVKRAKSGDREAFEAIATASYERMYSICRRVLRDSAAAEDAVQEALILIWRDLRALRDVDKFDAWSHRLLMRACFAQARNRRRLSASVITIDVERSDPHDSYATVAHRDELERAFAALPIEHRAVVVLTHYQGMSAPEVGAALGIPTGTVYSRLHYALRQMRSSMTEVPTGSPSSTLESVR